MEKITAPIPGKVVEINVKKGQTIAAGDTVLVLEAMKMENEVFCENGGEVQEIKVKEGDSVAANDVLMVIG
ncbi:MAG TPA: biotin/lipoyl-containing protein [Syntrophomonadaceae bacterium]|nr:biotin/lipoyl-containing protein [Syntrophomonadaceae bacterium]